MLPTIPEFLRKEVSRGSGEHAFHIPVDENGEAERQLQTMKDCGNYISASVFFRRQLHLPWLISKKVSVPCLQVGFAGETYQQFTNRDGCTWESKPFRGLLSFEILIAFSVN